MAAEKSEKYISQGIEKLLDGAVPGNEEEEYTFVLMAVPEPNVALYKNELGKYYTSLSPFEAYETNYTFTSEEGVDINKTKTTNLSVVLGEILNDTLNVTSGENHGNSSQSGNNFGANGGLNFLGIMNVGIGGGHMQSQAKIDSTSRAITKGKSNSSTTAINVGEAYSETVTKSISSSAAAGAALHHTNYTVKHTLELLDLQMKRLEHGSALGMWRFASYVISEDYSTANNVAHMYLSLTQGEDSFISRGAINVWKASDEDSTNDVNNLLGAITQLKHPLFALKEELENNWYAYPPVVYATTIVSGRELAYSFNLPRKSVAGFPVFECAEFGRNVVTYDGITDKERKIELGKIYHMHKKEDIPVNLSLDSLTAHTFITGSTKSGKSNLVYGILGHFLGENKDNVNFLVVEPSKGEYKNVFGNKPGVSVYGTNPKETPLLRLNPFSFPSEIAVYEHIDRLIEIFNACWPMYAAMPAVLKSAIEKSYSDCGWDIKTSTNPYGEDMYPTLADVVRNIRSIINSSEYDADNKGAYKGSLITRLQSLSNGINGMIFTTDEISFEELFDKNVIADISKVGSSETKSLIMGILVLKLQEYRMSCGGMNKPLEHITVLEEAHRLLRRTSFEQPSEGNNLVGKSVEMISNTIAEMRTYGEGFIVVDQAPALLDMAVIRNTNTKIILRLPDESDRELVGRAANLNDSQITELAKLPCGVSAVYQNEWIQPVLCKTEKQETEEKKYTRPQKENSLPGTNLSISDAIRISAILLNKEKVKSNAELAEIFKKLKISGVSASIIVKTINILKDTIYDPSPVESAPIIGVLFSDVKKDVARIINEHLGRPFDNDFCERCEKYADHRLRDHTNADIAEKLRKDIVNALVTDCLCDCGRYDDIKTEMIGIKKGDSEHNGHENGKY